MPWQQSELTPQNVYADLNDGENRVKKLKYPTYIVFISFIFNIYFVYIFDFFII